MILIIRLSYIDPFQRQVRKLVVVNIEYTLYVVVREPRLPLDTLANVIGQQSGGHGTVAPPVPIPNTEVKRCCADDSMTKGHAKVGHCQILNPSPQGEGFFLQLAKYPLYR